MQLQVRPGYGWGWSRADGSRMEVPAPFVLDAADVTEGLPPVVALGQLVAAEHPLDGLWILLTRRHATGLDYNVRAFPKRPRDLEAAMEADGSGEIVGYAVIE